MLRLAIVAAVVVMNSPALAQPIDEVKDLKFGAGCIGPVSTFAARLGTCIIEGSKSRVLMERSSTEVASFCSHRTSSGRCVISTKSCKEDPADRLAA